MRPLNINRIKSRRETVPKAGVMPIVTPTVQTADVVSKEAAAREIPSMWQMSIVQRRNEEKYEINISNWNGDAWRLPGR